MSSRTYIHINGQQYDASGSTLKPVNSQPTQSMDGVIKHSSAKPTHQPAPHHKRQLDKTKTLHRSVVKKPENLQVSKDKTSSKPLNTVSHRPTTHSAIPKSPAISRFPSTMSTDFVAQAPSNGKHYHDEAVPPPAAPPMSKSDILVERQLRIAAAHQNKHSHKKTIKDRLKDVHSGNRKMIGIGAMVVSGLLIAGFIFYQNIPGLSMQLASRRAGFNAMLPSFTPSGYSIDGPVAYSPGKVIISFGSNTNDHQYQIEQQPSRWTADTLREQVASSNGAQYQSYESKGLTIYFTADNTAMWVNRGVLFSLRGDSALNSEQIATIASSM